jgi:hypothetical protein
MTPSERIASALAIWPGRELDVAEKVGVSKSRLRVWAGLAEGRYFAPAKGDAVKVEVAVRELLVERLSWLVATMPVATPS